MMRSSSGWGRSKIPNSGLSSGLLCWDRHRSRMINSLKRGRSGCCTSCKQGCSVSQRSLRRSKISMARVSGSWVKRLTPQCRLAWRGWVRCRTRCRSGWKRCRKGLQMCSLSWRSCRRKQSSTAGRATRRLSPKFRGRRRLWLCWISGSGKRFTSVSTSWVSCSSHRVSCRLRGRMCRVRRLSWSRGGLRLWGWGWKKWCRQCRTELI